MTEYLIVKARPEHADQIMPTLRPADVVEIRRATGRNVAAVLKDSIVMSYDAIAAYADGELVLLAGVAPVSVLSSVGCPWLVGAVGLEKHALKMCRENKKYVQKWLSVFGKLENYVDNDNVVSQRWLQWLGFTLDEPAPYGAEGHLFRHFYQEGESCV